MDVLRSCSRQKIRFVENNPLDMADATWYRAAPTAKPFPEPHSFGSPVWDTVHPTLTDLGFQAQLPRTWTNGKRINSSRGEKWAGPVDYFITGAPAPAFLPRAINGTPVECLERPLGLFLGGSSRAIAIAIGGIKLGGSCVPGVPDCPLCPGGTPTSVLIGSSGFTVPSMNNVFLLPQTATPCIWQYDVGPGEYVRAFRTVDRWTVQFVSGADFAQYEDNVPDVCLGTSSVYQVASTMAGGDPFSIVGLP